MLNDFLKLNNQTEENTPPKTKEEGIPSEPKEQPAQPINAPPEIDPYRETPPEEEYFSKS